MKKTEKKLLEQFRKLSDSDQQTLRAFCNFLVAETAGPEQPSLTINSIPRPMTETVIAAMKRLNVTYRMVEPDIVLNDATQLLTQHLVQGRDAPEVIDDLEQLFKKYYDELCLKQGPQDD